MILYHAGNINDIKTTNYNELGIHMGTKDTARLIGDEKNVPVKKYHVDIKNALKVIDFPRWTWFVVGRYLMQRGIISNSDIEKIRKLKNGSTQDRKLINLIKSKGYDALEYENYFEGGGISYLIFDKNQISEYIHDNVINLANYWVEQIENNQIKTDKFKSWFGNSKVVDKHGKPLVVYHGTTQNFIKFDQPKYRKNEQLSFGFHFTPNPAFASKYASDVTVAREKHGGNVIPVYLKIENLLDVDRVVYETDKEWELVKALLPKNHQTFRTVKKSIDHHQTKDKMMWFQNALDVKNPKIVEKIIKSFGYDGVKYAARLSTLSPLQVTRQTYEETISYIVFDKNQIKSAFGNNGNFDIKSDNINEFNNVNNIRLYRGLEQKIEPNYNLSKTDAIYGYTTWTDNLELAKQYAGQNGYVYYIDLPISELGKNAIDEDPKSETYGDRKLFVKTGKNIALNNIPGDEYLLYTFHDLYDFSMIKQLDEM